MLKKRIIPCLDVKNGRTVKGINFVDIRDAGDAVELAARYSANGADELVFLDITATVEKRKTMAELGEKVAAEIDIPFTVGGGISDVEDASLMIKTGADKISINSAAFRRPELISDIASMFGSQCVVLAIDTRFEDGDWYVYLDGGRTSTGTRTTEWAGRAEKLGAGEILLTSMNNDGTKDGFALDITATISTLLNIPVIASGGAGKKEHFKEVFENTNASAALAASVFHFGEIGINDLKQYLRYNKIHVR
ncbi:MAG: imidazole glycerol phosphate synthase subunit HisF [Marinilabiliaceae bacterium]|jgi:cyclase|nr:imidazole glycerol phosphate synthase subunit HisF [Marinilabiliaceae bacterium]